MVKKFIQTRVGENFLRQVIFLQSSQGSFTSPGADVGKELGNSLKDHSAVQISVQITLPIDICHVVGLDRRDMVMVDKRLFERGSKKAVQRILGKGGKV